MHIFAHAGIGWILAETGRGDRRFRQAVFLSSLLPDLDGLTLLCGFEAYGIYHDRITHSIPFAIIVSVVACLLCRQYRSRSALFTQLAFFSHILGDYFLSGWPIALWFPFSRAEIESRHALWLGHPVNHLLNLVAVAIMVWMGWRFKRTPFEVLSVSLDRRICNLLFQAKRQSCAICGKPTNEKCVECGKAVCVRHAPLTFRFATTCSQCRKGMADHPTGG